MIPIVIALYAPVYHEISPVIVLAPFNLLSTCGKGRQRAALAG
ncbi:hypothetical protein [Nostoc sp.]